MLCEPTYIYMCVSVCVSVCFLSTGSLKAARRAAGAVTHAVDRVVSGKNRNAFCAVRPPGHHAGANGLLEEAVSGVVWGACLHAVVACRMSHVSCSLCVSPQVS